MSYFLYIQCYDSNYSLHFLLCNSKFGKKKILESTSMQSSIIYLFLFRRQFEKSHCSYYNDLNILKVLILEHFFWGACSIFYRSNYLGHMFYIVQRTQHIGRAFVGACARVC